VESGPSLAKLCFDRIDVIKPILPLFTGGGGWNSHRFVTVFTYQNNPNHRQIQHKPSPNHAIPLSLRPRSHTGSSKAKKDACACPAALWPYCSSDKRLGLAFFYLVSRTRISSVHEPEGELIPLALPDIFFKPRPIKYSFGVRGLLHAQACKDLPQSHRAVHESARWMENSRNRSQMGADGCG
jgi:hypothetical protein